MKLFRRWTKPQLEEAILALEEGISSGAQSISYPAGGSLSYTSFENATNILDQLYARLDELEGKRRRPSIQMIPFVVKRGY
ncbi:hypothetical protein ABE562_04835 [Brucella intermedia]|uniref:Uncharacterized protein n=1 Tax=Brucella intermedia GD04153 TaxID=2975438 RepID=A0AA42H4D7_9HYPH|nr:hypothetical protein [Brucella intermedia]MDH0123291.1 hypothetical protein [Brucella intermedia GD04153]